MIGDSVAHLRAAGREVIYDAEHFFDGYKADAAYALATLRAAVDAGATTVVLCDTNGGCLTDEVAAMTRSVVSEIGPRRSSGSMFTMTRAWRWLTPSPPSRPAPITYRAPSTATASDAATPTS